MATPKPKPAETEQDEVVNADRPPKFVKLTGLAEDDLSATGLRAFQQNREEEAFDNQGRVWSFAPGIKDGRTGLLVSVKYRAFDLGSNFVPSDQVQCEAGQALLRSVIVILAGSVR
jgi:hypothetical protein